MISVILPVRNGARTIGEAMTSVLAQTWRDLELIVVDDASTDGTAAMVAAAGDRRVRLVRRARSGGPAAARNDGIDAARGSLLAFIDADDVWLPAKLAMQEQALRRSSGAGLAYCWTDYVDSEGHPLFPDERPRIEGDALAALLESNFIVCGSSVLVLADAARAVGGFDSTLACAEDYDFHLRVAEQWPFALVPAALTRYRVSAQSQSSDLGRLERDHLKVAGRAFARGGARIAQVRRRRSLALFYRALTARSLRRKFAPRVLAETARFAFRCALLDPAIAWAAFQRGVIR